MVSSGLLPRNLSRTNLGGVIFGCTNVTMRECLVNQLFGLPGQHMSYVQNIEPGLPLFLFNYSDKKLYGIFEAEGRGLLNINPYGWSSNGSERTKYPAQVRICIRMQCEPLTEKQFKPIIIDNYRTATRFCFELDRTQASSLISLFGSKPVIGGSAKWIPKIVTNGDAALNDKDLTPSGSMEDFNCLDQSNTNTEVLRDTPCLYEQNQSSEIHSTREELESEEQLIYLKLKQLALERKDANSTSVDCEGDISVLSNINTQQLVDGSTPGALLRAANKKPESSSSDLQSAVHELMQGMEKLKDFSQQQLQKTISMEKNMVESKLEIQRLKNRVRLLESRMDPSTTFVDENLAKTFDINLTSDDELVFLLGGYDGYSWLSALDCYSLSRDVLKSLRPMSSIRSHAAAVVLNGHIYIFGGGNGDMWYNTVESYNPSGDEWTSCPTLSVEKGNLAGATLQGKLFAIGGGNRDNCLSDVEMFDPSLGRWVHAQSMLEKRFAPASATINGALYAVGGYDGGNYLNSAERYDPRAISWGKLPSMNTRRGCHSLVVFKEKLYAFGGYDGTRTVSSTEVLDPRFGSWTEGDPLNQPRGYAGAVVIGESIYVLGGVQTGPSIVETVECYKEDNGWSLTTSVAVGKRCFFSAVVL